MRRQDFHYELPEALIAHAPTQNRRDSRLLQLHGPSGAITDRRFADLLELLKPGDLMVFNNTRVIPARVFGRKDSGGRVEIMTERVLDTHRVLALIKSSKAPRPQSRLILNDGTELVVDGRRDDLFELSFPADRPALEVLESVGQMPLPPYIVRDVQPSDQERYQTVYGTKPGAVAAPTAGLHFDEALLAAIEQKGVSTAFVTLHVGAGTFQPVRVESIVEHRMHAEVMELDADVCAKVKAAKARGGRVIAVGTTSVRCLETAASYGELQPYQGETNIFIYPSYQFKVVDCLLTNFHLPESTLLMLVSAFAGYQHTLAAYRHAVAERYRFFSYGDAMFIHHNPAAATELPLGKA